MAALKIIQSGKINWILRLKVSFPHVSRRREIATKMFSCQIRLKDSLIIKISGTKQSISLIFCIENLVDLGWYGYIKSSSEWQINWSFILNKVFTDGFFFNFSYKISSYWLKYALLQTDCWIVWPSIFQEGNNQCLIL